MVYAQSIEDSKLGRIDRIFKRSGSSYQCQAMFKKKVSTQEPRSDKVKLEKGGGSQKVKPTCAKYGKKHYGECLLGTGVSLVMVRKDTR